MTLISILVGLGLEYFFGALDRVRNFRWFDAYIAWLEQGSGSRKLWDGPVGVLVTLALPLIALGIVQGVLSDLNVVLGFIFATGVFIYSLGPDLNTLLDRYTEALIRGDENQQADLEESLRVEGVTGEEAGERMLRSVLIRSHEHLFGVIFWFLVLGSVGALLYCLTIRLARRFAGIRGGFGDAILNLHRILMWPSIRLESVCLALAGSLVHALESWHHVKGSVLEDSEDIIGAVGLGAIQYQPPPADDEEHHAFADWVQELQALLNRALVVWLTGLGILTLGGWLV